MISIVATCILGWLVVLVVIRHLKGAFATGVVLTYGRPTADRANEPVWFWMMIGIDVFFLLFGLTMAVIGTYLVIQLISDPAIRAESGLW